MKIMVRLLVAALVMGTAIAGFTATVKAGDKKVVAVLPFESHNYSSWGQNAAEYLETLLVESGKFRVVDRKHLSRILKEHELGQMGLTEMSKELGRFIEADYLLGGSITPLGDSYSLNAKLIDMETAEIVVAKSTTFKNLSKLRRACQFVTKALAQRVYGTGSGNSKAELFSMSDSRQFFDAASYLVGQLEALTSNVQGSVDEVMGKKVMVQLDKKINFRPGIKVQVESDGFEGTDTIGTLYITRMRPNGRSEATFLEEPMGLGMGQRFSSVNYKNVVAIGPFEDAEEENAEFVTQFRKTLADAMGSASTITPANGVDSIVNAITPANRKAKLKALFNQGVDLMVTGRFIGAAGHRRLDMTVYNCFDGSKVKTIKLETKL